MCVNIYYKTEGKKPTGGQNTKYKCVAYNNIYNNVKALSPISSHSYVAALELLLKAMELR